MNVVYTKTKSLTFGGRSLLRDGMHLTEFSSFLGNITKTPSNKCYSQYLYPSLCRMVLHIALSGPCEGDFRFHVVHTITHFWSVLKKPFLSLARMVLFPHDYWDFECNKDAFLKNPSVVEPKSERDFHDYGNLHKSTSWSSVPRLSLSLILCLFLSMHDHSQSRLTSLSVLICCISMYRYLRSRTLFR